MMPKDRDWEKFENEAADYLYALNHVREQMYGSGNGNWSNLPGSCAEFVHKVTNEIWYSAFERDLYVTVPLNKEETESSGE